MDKLLLKAWIELCLKRFRENRIKDNDLLEVNQSELWDIANSLKILGERSYRASTIKTYLSNFNGLMREKGLCYWNPNFYHFEPQKRTEIESKLEFMIKYLN